MAKGAYIGINNVARKIKKGYIGIEAFQQITLPDGYTQVEYIESSGTQYIDTGFKPNQNTRVICDFYKSAQPADWECVFGSRDSNNNTNSFAFWLTADNTCGVFYSINGGDITYYPNTITASGRHNVDMNKNVAVLDGAEIVHPNRTFQGSYNMFLFSSNKAGSPSNSAKVRIHSCQIYDNGMLVREFVPCKSPSGTVGMYDLVDGTFYGNAGTGAFTAGNAHGSYARKIKKAYIGIGGVARPCWGGGELAYYGTVTGLSVARTFLSATTAGNYAFFSGGYGYDGALKTVDAYDKSLTRHTAPLGDSSMRNSAATSVGNYALFAGGYTAHNRVTAYDQSFTKTAAANMDYSLYTMAATSVGGYALFGGGTNSSGGGTMLVTAYNASLTKQSMYNLLTYLEELAATTVGSLAIFGGGYYNRTDYKTNLTTYNKSLTCNTPASPTMSVGRRLLRATAVGDYALFGGGCASSGYSTAVDAFSETLTRVIPTVLSVGRYEFAATTVGNYALFGGGYGGSKYYSAVDAYDNALTRTNPTELNSKRNNLAATTIGDYALFGGGATNGSSGYVATVDAYTIS